MDASSVAASILEKVGGPSNLLSVTHCATRLRLTLKDATLCDMAALKGIADLKGVQFSGQELQLIVGPGAIIRVYDAFMQLSGRTAASDKPCFDQVPWYRRLANTLGGIFVPILPAIVASGLLTGLLDGLSLLFPNMVFSGIYRILYLFSNASFTFLPVLVAFSAARIFRATPYMGAVLGLALIHPDLMDAIMAAFSPSVPTIPVWGGLFDIPWVGYQGRVIPVVLGVWLLGWLENHIRKLVPDTLDLFLTPLLSLCLSGYLTFTVIGPVLGFFERGLVLAVMSLLRIPAGLGAALCGALYSPTVVTGAHHVYEAMEAGMLAQLGYNPWLPIASAACIGQGAAALGIGLRTSDRRLHSMAISSSLPAFLGITEPAMFGINLRYGTAFWSGCIGGAVGGMVAGLLQIKSIAYGVNGLFGLLLTLPQWAGFCLVLLASFLTAFTLSLLLCPEAASPYRFGRSAPPPAAPHITLASPYSGRIVPLSDVPDSTFAKGLIGPGIGVYPSDGRVLSPCSGMVRVIFPGYHALGLRACDGTEFLLHIGLDAGRLTSHPFELHVSTGQQILMGQELLSFDPDQLTNEGCPPYCLFVITKCPHSFQMKLLADQGIQAGQPLFQVLFDEPKN